LEPDGFFASGPVRPASKFVRSKSGRIIFDVNPAKIRQKSGKKIEKNPVNSVRFIFDVTLTKIRQKSGKKIEKNPVSSGRTGAGLPDRFQL
jgi:hypothetical protein